MYIIFLLESCTEFILIYETMQVSAKASRMSCEKLMNENEWKIFGPEV